MFLKVGQGITCNRSPSKGGVKQLGGVLGPVQFG
jgi:hypothetical protein